ncbi:MAG: hypothetical protein LBO66_06905 [Deltaproteobacteria bacterium]|jgi:hypothetical protein|nr:hypothetical protein [Deltaproteobacteria bacterium]
MSKDAGKPGLSVDFFGLSDNWIPLLEELKALELTDDEVKILSDIIRKISFNINKNNINENNLPTIFQIESLIDNLIVNFKSLSLDIIQSKLSAINQDTVVAKKKLNFPKTESKSGKIVITLGPCLLALAL